MLGPELTLIDLGDGSEHLGGTPTVLTDEVAKAMEKLSFGEISK